MTHWNTENVKSESLPLLLSIIYVPMACFFPTLLLEPADIFSFCCLLWQERVQLHCIKAQFSYSCFTLLLTLQIFTECTLVPELQGSVNNSSAFTLSLCLHNFIILCHWDNFHTPSLLSRLESQSFKSLLGCCIPLLTLSDHLFTLLYSH